MAGPSGFVQRIKGKIQVDTTQIGRGGVNEYVYGVVDASSTPGATLPNNGVSLVKNSSANQVLILSAPEPGIEKTIVVTTISSGLTIKTNSTGVVFFDGVNSFWKVSTTAGIAGAMVLVGQSTAQWANLGIWPSTVGTAGMSASS